MKQADYIHLLKIIAVLVLFISIPALLFYLGIVVPEYCACDKTMYEGQKGVDIWGDIVYCDGESQDVAEAFFQLFTIVLLGCLALLAFIRFLIYRIKKNNK